MNLTRMTKEIEEIEGEWLPKFNARGSGYLARQLCGEFRKLIAAEGAREALSPVTNLEKISDLMEQARQFAKTLPPTGSGYIDMILGWIEHELAKAAAHEPLPQDAGRMRDVGAAVHNQADPWRVREDDDSHTEAWLCFGGEKVTLIGRNEAGTLADKLNEKFMALHEHYGLVMAEDREFRAKSSNPEHIVDAFLEIVHDRTSDVELLTRRLHDAHTVSESKARDVQALRNAIDCPITDASVPELCHYIKKLRLPVEPLARNLSDIMVAMGVPGATQKRTLERVEELMAALRRVQELERTLWHAEKVNEGLSRFGDVQKEKAKLAEGLIDAIRYVVQTAPYAKLASIAALVAKPEETEDLK
jgi:hypothetical protein